VICSREEKTTEPANASVFRGDHIVPKPKAKLLQLVQESIDNASMRRFKVLVRRGCVHAVRSLAPHSQSHKSAPMVLSARARRPDGNSNRTLPDGRSKTRSISRCPVATVASRRSANLRRAGCSPLFFYFGLDVRNV